jgi:hypothetical protein
MQFFFFLFFFGPAHSLFHFPSQPSLAGLSFFSSLHPAAQSSSRPRASIPRPNGPPALQPSPFPSLSRGQAEPACRDRPRPRAGLGLTASTRVRHPGPACQGSAAAL